MNGTRPDIAFVVNAVSRAKANPTGLDWKTFYQIFDYLCGTADKGLLYRGQGDNPECYSDA